MRLLDPLSIPYFIEIDLEFGSTIYVDFAFSCPSGLNNRLVAKSIGLR